MNISRNLSCRARVSDHLQDIRDFIDVHEIHAAANHWSDNCIGLCRTLGRIALPVAPVSGHFRFFALALPDTASLCVLGIAATSSAAALGSPQGSSIPKEKIKLRVGTFDSTLLGKGKTRVLD